MDIRYNGYRVCMIQEDGSDNMTANEFIEKLKKFISEIDVNHPIELAYLFGSFARGTQNDESDIDLAVLFKNKHSDIEEITIRGELSDRGEFILGRKVDIVSLEKAPLLLKYEIVKDGVVLKDSSERGNFESLVLREYFDFKYYSEIYNKAVIESIKSKDYFGRGE